MKNLFAERFSELLKQHRWSYEELAKRLGLQSKGTISKYAKGNIKNVNLSMVIKIAKLYQVSPIWLLGLQENKYASSSTNDAYSYIPAIDSNGKSTSCGMLVSKKLLSSNHYTVFQCGDFSMSPFIQPNDLLLIEMTENFKNGDLCLIAESKHFIIRKVSQKANTTTLLPLHSDFATARYSSHQLKSNSISIMGIVRKLERNY